MKKLMIGVAAAMAAFELMAINGTVSTENESFAGDIKWHARDKKYIVEKGKITKEFALADVTGLDIAKPQGYDAAVAKVEQGQGTGAIAILQKIVTEYKMLFWDKPAGRYLAMAYLSSKNAQKALEVCESIIAGDKTAAYSGDVAFAYWQALMALGKNEQLEKYVKKAATSGNRQSSAAALVMRGDIIVSTSNDAPDKLRDALRDGYLRVVLMYQDAECVRERADAMVKAAKCFDKLGQSARAENLRAQAKAL